MHFQVRNRCLEEVIMGTFWLCVLLTEKIGETIMTWFVELLSSKMYFRMILLATGALGKFRVRYFEVLRKDVKSCCA